MLESEIIGEEKKNGILLIIIPDSINDRDGCFLGSQVDSVWTKEFIDR